MSIYEYSSIEYSGVRLTQAHGHEVVAGGGEALQPGLAVPDHPGDVPGLHPRPDQLGQLQLADAAQDLIGRERAGSHRRELRAVWRGSSVRYPSTASVP